MAMQYRKIRFLADMLNNQQVIAAIAADCAVNQIVNDDFVETGDQGTIAAIKSVVEFSDENMDDYPNLRAALALLSASYDFHQRRQNDGDNAVWHHGRNGKEIVANFGISAEVVPPL